MASSMGYAPHQGGRGIVGGGMGGATHHNIPNNGTGGGIPVVAPVGGNHHPGQISMNPQHLHSHHGMMPPGVPPGRPLPPPGSSPTATNVTNADPQLDERLVARASLEECEERVRELCTKHAGAFVAVERRGVALRDALSNLLEAMEACVPLVDDARDDLRMKDSEIKEGNDKDEEGKDEEDELVGRGESLATLAERHRLRRRTLLQHSALLELLELPGLMDACVRSNLYDEALGVAGFANTLERRHHLQQSSSDDVGQQGKLQHGGGVVSAVIAEIRARELDLRRHLLSQLRGDVTMPQCLEIVTALRRLNGIELERRGAGSYGVGGRGGGVSKGKGGGSNCGHGPSEEDLERTHSAMEIRLQVDFFEARDKWLERGDSVFAVGGSSGGGTATASTVQSEQLLDCIERHRTRCFEIATQFLAIFHTSPSPLSTSYSSGVSGDFGKKTGSTSRSMSLLSMWCTRRINAFLASLRRQLDESNPSVSTTTSGVTATTSQSIMSGASGSAAALRDALDAAVFFAASMGRIGCDFQCLLPPLFQPRLVAVVVGKWNSGLDTLGETLKICRDAGVASPLHNPSVADGSGGGMGDDGAGASSSMSNWPSSPPSGGNVDVCLEDTALGGGGETPSPPRSLLAYPPLARLINSFLTGLNELRRCLLPGAFPQLRLHLQRIVDESRKVLEMNEKKVLTPGFLRGEAARLREIAPELREVFDNVVEPYLRKALDVALGCKAPGQEEEEEEQKQDAEEDNGEDEEEEEEEEEETNGDGEKDVGDDVGDGDGDSAADVQVEKGDAQETGLEMQDNSDVDKVAAGADDVFDDGIDEVDIEE